MKIGTFAFYARISIRMLRHYDELGLLKPESVDPSSNYRQYAPRQLLAAQRITLLRNLGFNLQEIKAFLHDPCTESQRRRLEERLRQQEGIVEKEQAKAEHIRAALSRTQGGSPMNPEITVKTAPSQHMAALRDPQMVKPMPNGGLDISELWHTLYERMPTALSAAGSTLIWHERVGSDALPDPELMQPLQGEEKAPSPFRETILEEAQVASAVYQGHYADQGMSDTFAAVYAWPELHGYRATGPIRQVFHGPKHIELQLPISK